MIDNLEKKVQREWKKRGDIYHHFYGVCTYSTVSIASDTLQLWCLTNLSEEVRWLLKKENYPAKIRQTRLEARLVLLTLTLLYKCVVCM